MKTILMLFMAMVAVLCCSPAQAQFCANGQCFGGPPMIIYGQPPVPLYAQPVYVVQDVPVITQQAAKPDADTPPVVPADPPPPRPRPDYHFSPQCAPVLIPGPPCYSHCMPTPYRVKRSIGVGLTLHWNSSRR